jgi:hypothetical protein
MPTATATAAYTTRLLPPEEWPRLAGTAADGLWQHCRPDHTRMVVVEDAEGVIVACTVLYHVVHAECPWIAPDARRSAAVGRALLRGIAEQVTAWSSVTLMVNATLDHLRALIRRLGGMPLPGDWYVLTPKGSVWGSKQGSGS